MSSGPFATANLAGYVGDDPAAVALNRLRLVGAMGLPAGEPAVAGAVHGGSVAVVDRPGLVEGVDGLVTRTPGLVILALGADCVPLALIGADGLTVAVAHCGWRGLVADVVGEAVRVVRDFGTEVRTVILGPAVCGQCYPVPADRADEVRAATAPTVHRAAIMRTEDGQPGIDVRAGLTARLADLGIADVRRVGGCTVEDTGLFSYRRDRTTGRQGMAIALAP